MIRSLLILFLSLSSASLPGIAGEDLYRGSMAQIARQEAPPLLEKIVTDLGNFNEDTLPHEAKELRKTVLKLRDFIDLFAAVYPVESANKDTWAKLRADLDQGYEKIGFFKDLFDSQGMTIDAAEYDRSELEQRRKPVLKWQKKFLTAAKLAKYRSYLAHPVTDRLEIRESQAESKFYWGGANTAPESHLTAGTNLAKLLVALCEIAAVDHITLADAEKLTNPDDETIFHDFRKRARSVLKILGYFPSLLAETEQARTSQQTLSELVLRFGEIEDLIVAYHFAKEKNKDRKARELSQEIKRKWKKLRDWQDESDTVDMFFTNGTVTSSE
ncbi:hypothetical protein E3A20_13870, partial [Planctomyces bekefii]